MALPQALKTSGNRLREDDFPSSFEAYVRRGEDLFGIIAHFNSWLSSKTTYRIVMVRSVLLKRRQISSC